jgi:hypothetical protein
VLQVVVEEQDAEAAALRDYLPVAFGTLHTHRHSVQQQQQQQLLMRLGVAS